MSSDIEQIDDCFGNRIWVSKSGRDDICPSCGEPGTFDADTFTRDCDECVGYRRALPNLYRAVQQER